MELVYMLTPVISSISSSSSSKILGKSAFSAPQSEMAGALLAYRMEQKIKQE